jgi:predicted DNA-binding WGR domain protein
MTTRFFNFTDTKSNKFWWISWEGKSITVNYGRIGTLGSGNKKEFADEASCLKEVNKLIAEKIKKGYIEEIENDNEDGSIIPIVAKESELKPVPQYDESESETYFNEILTTSKGFFEDKIVLKMIQDLKNAGIKMEGEFTEGVSTGDDTFDIYHKIHQFERITGEKKDFLYDVLKKDQNDLFKFIFLRANDGQKRPYAMVPSSLMFFTFIKYFPEKLEEYLSLFWRTAKQTARMFKKQYNEALGIGNKK